MLKGFFPDAEPGDYEQLLAQLLKQQSITPPQWQILLETNAHLRKMAEPLCAGKITEDNIKQAFDLQYGGLVKIRDIQVSNIAEAQEVKRRLADNEKFEDVARALSKDPRTAGLGGDWPAFSAKSTTVSDILKQQAFTLKVGEVSDALNTEGVFHIIKVEERIPPKVAKLDATTHAYLLNTLMEGFVQDTMKRLRNQLAQEALQPNIMQIRDPELKKQFDLKVAEHQAAAKEEENARRLQTTKRLLPATVPTTQAETAPGERPPATQSGAATRPATDPTDNKK
jgi:parvulin-like peptidyl-prolyl isomerase